MLDRRGFQAKAQGEREIQGTREFDGPPEMVWDAFTKPELLRRWMLGPDGWVMKVCEMDLRVGGAYRYVWYKGGTFVLEGQTFYCMDAGPQARFTMALSLYVDCKTQKEVDHYYDNLSKGGEKQPCSWVLDKFGVSWQIVPDALPKLMGDKNKDKANRVMQAMMQMQRIDIAKIKKAYAGK